MATNAGVDATVASTSTSRSTFVLRTRLSAGIGTVILGSCLVIIAGSSLVAWNGDVPGWEEATLRWFNGWPDQLEAPLWVVQQFGLLAAPLIAGMMIVWSTGRRQLLIPFVLVLPLKLILEKAVLKQLVDRERPYVSIGSNIDVRGPAFEGPSFPSGHSTTAFALATLLAAFMPPRWRPLPFGWASAVAATRLYYGEHNVLDVVAGAALGVAFATVLWFLVLNRWVQPASSEDGS